MPTHGYGVFDGFREEEVKHRAGDERRGEMGGEIMVDE
jgi:hypothetical protein